MAKLTSQQVRKLRQRLHRVGESDIRVGECRKVTKGVVICRRSKTGYHRTTKRAVPKSTWG